MWGLWNSFCPSFSCIVLDCQTMALLHTMHDFQVWISCQLISVLMNLKPCVFHSQTSCSIPPCSLHIFNFILFPFKGSTFVHMFYSFNFIAHFLYQKESDFWEHLWPHCSNGWKIISFMEKNVDIHSLVPPDLGIA